MSKDQEPYGHYDLPSYNPHDSDPDTTGMLSLAVGITSLLMAVVKQRAFVIATVSVVAIYAILLGSVYAWPHIMNAIEDSGIEFSNPYQSQSSNAPITTQSEPVSSLASAPTDLARFEDVCCFEVTGLETGTDLIVRDTPYVRENGVLTEISQGEVFLVYGCIASASPNAPNLGAQWCYVNFEDVEGWSYGGYIRSVAR